MIFLKSFFIGLLTAVVGSFAAAFVGLAILTHKAGKQTAPYSVGFSVVDAAHHPVYWAIVLVFFLAGFLGTFLLSKRRASPRT